MISAILAIGILILVGHALVMRERMKRLKLRLQSASQWFYHNHAHCLDQCVKPGVTPEQVRAYLAEAETNRVRAESLKAVQ